MKTPTMKSSTTRKTPSKPTTASTQAQTTTATGTPGTPSPPPPPQRALELDCYLGDEQRSHRGALISVRARFNPWREQVCIMAKSDGYRFAHAFLDHVATRAALHSTRESLAVLKRFQSWRGRETNFGQVRQFQAISFDKQQPSADVTVEPSPASDIVHLTIIGGSRGRSFRVDLYLTPLEAEALALDLERALQDMERFGDFEL